MSTVRISIFALPLDPRARTVGGLLKVAQGRGAAPPAARADLLVATEDDLRGVPDDEVPINVLPGADIKGIGIIELDALRALLMGGPIKPDVDDCPFVGRESEDGPWLNRFPDDFVEALAKLKDNAADDLVAKWAQDEQLKRSDWTIDVARERLQDSRRVAQLAQQQGKPLHLWTCL